MASELNSWRHLTHTTSIEKERSTASSASLPPSHHQVAPKRTPKQHPAPPKTPKENIAIVEESSLVDIVGKNWKPIGGMRGQTAYHLGLGPNHGRWTRIIPKTGKRLPWVGCKSIPKTGKRLDVARSYRHAEQAAAAQQPTEHL